MAIRTLRLESSFFLSQRGFYFKFAPAVLALILIDQDSTSRNIRATAVREHGTRGTANPLQANHFLLE